MVRPHSLFMRTGFGLWRGCRCTVPCRPRFRPFPCRRREDAVRRHELYFAESIWVLAAEPSSTGRRVRWRAPHGCGGARGGGPAALPLAPLPPPFRGGGIPAGGFTVRRPRSRCLAGCRGAGRGGGWSRSRPAVSVCRTRRLRHSPVSLAVR